MGKPLQLLLVLPMKALCGKCVSNPPFLAVVCQDHWQWLAHITQFGATALLLCSAHRRGCALGCVFLQMAACGCAAAAGTHLSVGVVSSCCICCHLKLHHQVLISLDKEAGVVSQFALVLASEEAYEEEPTVLRKLSKELMQCYQVMAMLKNTEVQQRTSHEDEYNYGVASSIR